MSPLILDDFSGGLNLRDSPNELALNETPAAFNWTLDTRGAAKTRKGCLNAVALPGTAAAAAYIFYSPALNLWFCHRGTTLYKRLADLSGAWTSVGTVNAITALTDATSAVSISDGVAIVEFPGNPPKIVIVGAGVWTYDGTTLTSVSATVQGYAAALWQNRVWVAGYPSSDANGNPARLFACKIGDPSGWAAPDLTTVEFRDKDASRLTGLGLAGGALIVFKKRSAYRVNDSANGSYGLIDGSSGCVQPRAVVSLRGRVYAWGADDLYEFDGIGPGKRVGTKVRTLFATDPTFDLSFPSVCGGVLEDRVLFAYPSAPNGNADRLLEYDPEHRWLMKHQLASSTKDEINAFALKDADLYAAVRDGDVIFKVFSETPGADDAVLFSANNFRTKWLQPNGGLVARIHKAIIEGLTVTAGTTTITMRVYKDWDLSSFDSYDLSTDLRGGDANDQVETSVVRSLGHSRSFAFEFVAGAAAGAAQVNSLVLDFTVLEN